jgi:hypothetical protein
VVVSSRNIIIGGLYILPWKITATINSAGYYQLEENDIVVLLSYKEKEIPYTSFSTTYYTVEVLLPTGAIGTVDATESALKHYWKLAKNGTSKNGKYIKS